MKSTKQVDQEIAKSQQVLADLETARQEILTKLESTREKRAGLSLASLTGDSDAAKEIESLRSIQLKLQLELEDSDSAVRSAKRQLEHFQQARQQAIRDDKRATYRRECESLLADAEAAEECLQTLTDSVERVRSRVAAMDRLVNEAGIEPQHKNILRNLRHAIEQRLNLAPVYMFKDFKNFFRGSLDKVFAATLNGAVAEISSHTNGGTMKQTASENSQVAE